jgi:MFS family permease
MSQADAVGEEAGPPPRWAALAGVIAALTMFGAAQGLSYPLFTLLMQGQGLPPAMIGLSAAMMPLGLILSAPFVPAAVGIAGARGLAVGCAIGGAVLFLLVGLLQDWFAWFVLRFLLGVVINPLYILGEVWALALAPARRRGRIMGVFNTMLGAGYALGPLVLATIGIAGLTPFAVGVGGFVACACVLYLVSRDLPGFEDKEEAASGTTLAFARTAPALLAAVGVAAATQQSTYALLPVFGAAYGLQAAVLAALLTALSVGNIVLQMPLGFAAERFGGRAMVVGCALMTAVLASLLPAAILSPAIWPLLVILGGVGYGTYTMALVELGSRFRGRALVTGNAAFALMWGLGGMLGPPGSGLLLQMVGPVGLPLVIAGLSSCLVAFLLFRSWRRKSSP